MHQLFFEQNKQLWNDRVSVHLKSELYNMERFMAGKSSLTELDKNAFGDVAGKTLLHLQCHFGQDTLSWAREGAVVTGVDFSEKAIEAAEKISAELGLDARFILANIYELPQVLNEQFDLVFTTFGAIPWLPNMEKWAGIVGQCLKPGGLLFVAEFHPALYLFNFDNKQVEYSYFTENDPYMEEVEGSYADPEKKTKGREYFWNHAISEVLNPLLANGLELLALNEYDFSPFNCFPNMVEREPGRFVWDPFGQRLPHVFCLKMRKK
jgi:2-polyprenyl-3-methyl-5-hydroxy-6-metoxy-1,4-benzoquinol methylase